MSNSVFPGKRKKKDRKKERKGLHLQFFSLETTSGRAFGCINISTGEPALLVTIYFKPLGLTIK